jgi:hypothetical protein
MRAMSSLRRLVLSSLLLAGCALAQAAAPRLALVTMLDGEGAQVLRDDGRFAAAEGVALQSGDILATGARTRLLRIEYPDGHALALGPGAQVLLDPRLGGALAKAGVYVLAGWTKLEVPQGQAVTLAGPPLAVSSVGGAAVASWPTASGGAMVFAESGALQLQSRARAGAPAVLASGQMLALAGSGTKPELAPRPTPAFVQAMPRAFMDSLPPRAAAFAGKEVAPRPLGPLAYADAQPWLDAEPALRQAFARRWRAKAHDAEFRRGLVAGLKAHPEWEPVLFPPMPRAGAAAPH